MNLKELPFPIRIYWDLTPEPDLSLQYSDILEQVVDMKFFTLNLLDEGDQLSDACIEILQRLKEENITVSLSLSQNSFKSSDMNKLSGQKVNEILVDADSEDDLRQIAESLLTYKADSMTIGASFRVRESNFRRIPDIVSFCLDNDITRLAFPMQRLKEKKDCFYVSREEGALLTNRLRDLDFEKMRITIHDPFLWRVFYPAVSFPGAGCQAANSMAYLSSDAKVYPCPSMPIELGDLSKSSLKSILSSDSKKELVKSLHDAPEECVECEELSGCMGGCCGRVYVLSGSLKERDPACN